MTVARRLDQIGSELVGTVFTLLIQTSDEKETETQFLVRDTYPFPKGETSNPVLVLDLLDELGGLSHSITLTALQAKTLLAVLDGEGELALEPMSFGTRNGS